VSDIDTPRDGATPYALGTPDELAETARAIEAHGRRSLAVPGDVTVAAHMTRVVAQVEERLGGLDVLVANAGVIAAGAVAAMDEAQWDRIFAVNVKGSSSRRERPFPRSCGVVAVGSSPLPRWPGRRVGAGSPPTVPPRRP
jgi:NAD(P)-dependent dehydrogenase (short-subunit alcohol dehydrogenase family)